MTKDTIGIDISKDTLDVHRLSTGLRNPGSSGHRFRKYPATQSNFIRPLIPGYSATLVM